MYYDRELELCKLQVQNASGFIFSPRCGEIFPGEQVCVCNDRLAWEELRVSAAERGLPSL